MLFLIDAKDAKQAEKGSCHVVGTAVVDGEGTSKPKMIDGKAKAGTGGKAYVKGRLNITAKDGRTFGCGFAAFEAKGSASTAAPVKPLAL